MLAEGWMARTEDGCSNADERHGIERCRTTDDCVCRVTLRETAAAHTLTNRTASSAFVQSAIACATYA